MASRDFSIDCSNCSRIHRSLTGWQSQLRHRDVVPARQATWLATWLAGPYDSPMPDCRSWLYPPVRDLWIRLLMSALCAAEFLQCVMRQCSGSVSARWICSASVALTIKKKVSIWSAPCSWNREHHRIHLSFLNHTVGKGTLPIEHSDSRYHRLQHNVRIVRCTEGVVTQGVTKRCLFCLSWLTSYMSTNAGGGGVAGSQPMSTAVHMEPR